VTTLSVVIGAVGQVERTARCVESVRACSALAPEIVLVDNGSTRDESLALARLGAHVLLWREPMLGYAAAMNAGVAAASGEYLCLLNNDTEIVQEGWDARLVSVLQTVPGAAVVAPACSYSAHPSQQMVGPRPAEEMELLLTSDVPFVCAIMRRDLYQSLGGLDEGYGLGNFEDIDFCWRARAQGGQIVIDPGVWLRHDGHATMDSLADFAGLLDTNRERFIEKWRLGDA